MLILAAVLFVTVKLSKIQKDTSFNKEDIEVVVNTSKQLCGLLGGGIRISGEYVPVELEKVNTAIESMKNGIG